MTDLDAEWEFVEANIYGCITIKANSNAGKQMLKQFNSGVSQGRELRMQVVSIDEDTAGYPNMMLMWQPEPSIRSDERQQAEKRFYSACDAMTKDGEGLTLDQLTRLVRAIRGEK